jgi:hypothetical protein
VVGEGRLAQLETGLLPDLGAPRLAVAGEEAEGRQPVRAGQRRLTRRGGEPLLDLTLFRDRAFSAGTAVNFALVFFFGSFMFVLTLLLQAGLSQSPLRAGLEAGPLALTFTTMSILGPRLAARLGPWSITLGAGLDVLGTIGLVLTGVRYGGHLTGWDLAPATAVIGLGGIRRG